MSTYESNSQEFAVRCPGVDQVFFPWFAVTSLQQGLLPWARRPVAAPAEDNIPCAPCVSQKNMSSGSHVWPWNGHGVLPKLGSRTKRQSAMPQVYTSTERCGSGTGLEHPGAIEKAVTIIWSQVCLGLGQETEPHTSSSYSWQVWNQKPKKLQLKTSTSWSANESTTQQIRHTSSHNTDCIRNQA